MALLRRWLDFRMVRGLPHGNGTHVSDVRVSPMELVHMAVMLEFPHGIGRHGSDVRVSPWNWYTW